MDNTIIVVGAVADDPFAIDVAHYMGQELDISDLLSYKRFANTEFCPRFICDESDSKRVGHGLDGKTVIIISTCCAEHTRNARAMRSFLVARAAKDNGADRVILVEPDLYYSAQDRGPRPEHGNVAFERTPQDFRKFDGQPFSSRLYAQLLHVSGVDQVVTVHNHSVSVDDLFSTEFEGRYENLSPAKLYASYLVRHQIMKPAGDSSGFIVCAPDKGAVPFVKEVFRELQEHTSRMLIKSEPSLLLMDKERKSEREVVITTHPDSPTSLYEIEGQDVVVFDDMVRTGSTIAECCRQLKLVGARSVVFVVTHFYSSPEVKENLNDAAIDEIVTTNTLPTILNRDMQGRLRRKMLVLKIERWIANTLRRTIFGESAHLHLPPYTIDVSRKNPLWRLTRDLQDT